MTQAEEFLITSSSDGMVQVEDIVIEGNRRVAESTIRSYLPVQIGDRVTLKAGGIINKLCIISYWKINIEMYWKGFIFFS